MLARRVENDSHSHSRGGRRPGATRGGAPAAARGGAGQAQPGGAQPVRRVVALLDYVSNDYARAVGEHGELLSEAEHSEQVGFVQDAARELRADAGARGEDLAKRLDALVGRVEARAPPAEVAQAARSAPRAAVQ